MKMTFLSLLAFTLLGSTVWAGPSAYRQAQQETALQSGFPIDSVSVLTRLPADGREAIAKKLIEKLDGRFGERFVAKGLVAVKRETAGNRDFYKNGASYAEFFADGSKFRFRGDLDNPDYIAKGREKGRMSDAELENRGRQVIGQLKDLIPLGAQEELTFRGTRFLKNMAFPAPPQNAALTGIPATTPEAATPEPVYVANIAIFGRKVNGVPVVGPGSRVRVWFDNLGNLVSLEGDWPRYQVATGGPKQEVLPWAELKERVERVSVPLDVINGTRVRHFECGYVDLGARRRGGPIQAGCLLSYVRTRTSEKNPDMQINAGFLEFIPAGRKVMADKHWPLAQTLASGGSIEDFLKARAERASKDNSQLTPDPLEIPQSDTAPTERIFKFSPSTPKKLR